MTDQLRKRITDTIAKDRVMLFMKGNPPMPQCGFSAAVVGMLKEAACRSSRSTSWPTRSCARG